MPKFVLISVALLMTMFSLSSQGTAGEKPPCAGLETALPQAIHTVIQEAAQIAETGAYTRAAARLSAYIKAHPRTSPAFVYYELGYFLYRAGATDEAGRHLETALDLAPCAAEIWRLLAATQHSRGRVEAAATAMARAADLSDDPALQHQCALLWLEAGKPEAALPMLKSLCTRHPPKAAWLITLAGTYQMLEQIQAAAVTMEQAARVSGKGGHFHRAALLWWQARNSVKALALLKTCVTKQPVKACWQVDLATLHLEKGESKAAEAVMLQIDLLGGQTPCRICFRGASVWLNLGRPHKALPILEKVFQQCCPKFRWQATLVRVLVETGNMARARTVLAKLIDRFPEKPDAWNLAVWLALQQANHAGAAAAMEVLIRLDSADKRNMTQLSRYYALAGVPVKAAAALEKAVAPAPSPADLDRLTSIYLSGRRYGLALEPAKAAAAAAETVTRWETVGDIAYRLHHYRESCQAYERAAVLSNRADILLKAGYAALKNDCPEQAATLFTAALDRAGPKSATARAAQMNLAYIAKMNKLKDET